MTDVKQVLANWHALRRTMEKIDKLVLQLMRHPDATPAQLKRVHKSYVELWQKHMETKQILREKFPPGPVLQYPWNK